jgi:hypothetical protein
VFRSDQLDLRGFRQAFFNAADPFIEVVDQPERFRESVIRYTKPSVNTVGFKAKLRHYEELWNGLPN